MRYLAQIRRTAAHFYRSRADRVRATLRDRRLAGRLRTAFERDLQVAKVRGLQFYAYHGVVTIYGTVRHELDRELLVGFIRQVQGVKGVVEHLQVEGKGSPAVEAPHTPEHDRL